MASIRKPDQRRAAQNVELPEGLSREWWCGVPAPVNAPGETSGVSRMPAPILFFDIAGPDTEVRQRFLKL
jgi:hypothetical protein